MKEVKSEKSLHSHESEIRSFCWGLLFHLLHLHDRAVSHLDEVKKEKKDDEFSYTLQGIAAATRAYEITEKKYCENRDLIFNGKRDIIKQLGMLLDFNNHEAVPKLSKECPRLPQKSKSRLSNDGFASGYSRDPFKEIDPNNKPALALAAIAYLLRADSLFFARSLNERDFNAAKVTLNDIFQASQLATRLYHSLPVSHTRRAKGYFTTEEKGIDISQAEYLKLVRNGFQDENPWDSPFFIWNLHQLVEIERGNVYRSINYLNEADHFFRHAQERLNVLFRICKNNEKMADDLLLNLTSIKAVFERSKVLFDQGFFIKSLLNQLQCLDYILRRCKESGSAQTIAYLQDIECAVKYFKALCKQSSWEKESITKFFGLCDTSVKSKRDMAISPARFKDLLAKDEDDVKILATEVFVHIGYLLILFQRGNQLYGNWNAIRTRQMDAYRKHVKKVLKPFFTLGRELKIKRVSSLAMYCLTIIGDKVNDKSAFPESIEREFAYKLRSNSEFKRFSGTPLMEQEFFGRLLDIFTQNIDNIITLPRRLQKLLMRPGYFIRKSVGDLSAKTVFASFETSLRRKINIPGAELNEKKKMIGNKFVVLRRWQSFNPKIPCRALAHKAKGGGHFLIWNGKGVVIDPGYDFIQNFYDEGFSLADIDAVIITHSHPDHDDDLSTLTTLVKEWNNYYEELGYDKERQKKIDLFLNESTSLKFSAWLKASHFGLGRVVPLPLVVWDEQSKNQDEDIRGKNVFIRLRDKYSFDLEIVPAWHDDVIGKTAAIGLKFHLFKSQCFEAQSELGVIGYTGDTGTYIRRQSDKKTVAAPDLENIEDQYQDCDVLVANLGDIRLRDLNSSMSRNRGSAFKPSSLDLSLQQLFQNWFCHKESISYGKVKPEKIEPFLHLLMTLNLIPSWAQNECLYGSATILNLLNKYIHGDRKLGTEEQIKKGLDELLKKKSKLEALCFKNNFRFYDDRIVATENERVKTVEINCRIVCRLLGFLCASISPDWSYEYHLGVSGIFTLKKKMEIYALKQDRKRVFVVAELPEELASYRHNIAKLLNMTEDVAPGKKKKIYSFTGDIGLHIRLLDETENKISPKIRCSYCNHNNEVILNNQHYHSPEYIIETPLKRLDSAMIYLCLIHDHFPENPERPLDFLSRPVLRVI